MASHIAGLYDMENTLGSGHFAVVKSARHVFTGLRVAVKVIDKLKLDEVSRTHLYQEVRCMKLVTHPSIIRLYEVIDTQTKLYLIQELGDGGDLYDYIMKHPNGVEEDIACRIFKQAVSAIRYCHKLHVVHRDLKPENLVFCSRTDQSGNPAKPRVKLTDFGLSRTFLPGELIESSCGSLEYSAPEILLGDSYDPPKIDVWSLGVILYMLITGRSPFAYGGAGEILTRIMDGKYNCPSHVSAKCTVLIQSMLLVDSSRRASLDEVVAHPWLEGVEDEDDAPLPTISNVEEIPPSEVELIVCRMEQGGYGTSESILKLIKEKPYGSTAATFFLLAEAERYRKYTQSQNTPSRVRKNTTLFSPTTQNGPITSPFRSLGSAESGVLQRRTTAFSLTPSNQSTSEKDPFNVLRRTSDGTKSSHGTPVNTTTPTRKLTSHTSTPNVPSHLPSDPTSPHIPNTISPFKPFQSPRTMGVAGEQRSLIQTPKPAFPLNVQSSEDPHRQPLPAAMIPTAAPAQAPAPPVMENIDHSPYIFRSRAFSVVDEESETESLTDITIQQQPQVRQMSSSPPHTSPHHPTSPHASPNHPSSPHISPQSRSRRLKNARSSPTVFGSISKSDISDDEEEEDDDIVELMTTSGRFPNKGGTFPRTSPSNSPLLVSRRSPTHYLTGSSDDEISVFDSSIKHRSKRHPYRKRSIPKLARVDSISSDDGREFQQTTTTRRQKLLRLRQYNSLPSTPADENSATEGLNELLDTMRRNRSGSNRTDSSQSDGGGGDKDMGELARSVFTMFEQSDEDSGHVMMETNHSTGTIENGTKGGKEGGGGRRTSPSTTLRSVFCNVL